jgi:alanyl-tRNA synthetase
MAAVLVTTESPLLVVVARSQDVTLDSGAVLTRLITRFGGKGGGRGTMAQGGGLSGTPVDVLNAAREVIGEC